jgi:hypothetical protein
MKITDRADYKSLQKSAEETANWCRQIVQSLPLTCERTKNLDDHDLTCRCRTLQSESRAYVGKSKASDSDRLLTRGFTPEHCHRAARNAESGGEELAERGIGASFDRRRVHLYF